MSQQQERSAQAPPASQTTTDTIRPEAAESSPRVILRLRGGHTSNGRSVQWAEDVVDNEGLGRKSSKGMCMRKLRRAVPKTMLYFLFVILAATRRNEEENWKIRRGRLENEADRVVDSVLHISSTQGS